MYHSSYPERMTEDEWWERYKAMLQALPYTDDDPLALIDLLQEAGFYLPRTGLPKPCDLSPERCAVAAWRVRYDFQPRITDGVQRARTEAVIALGPWLSSTG